MVIAFESSLAKEIGVKEAIILSHIAFWVRKNEADERNIHDGKAWTFSTQKALSTYFDFLSEKQVRTTMANLKEQGLIETGNFNTSPYDKTTWYTLTERGKQWTDLSLRTDQMVAPIPYITTDINKEKEKESTNVLSKEKENADFNRFWSAYPKKKSKADAEKAFKKVKVPVEVLLNAIEKQKKSADWIKNNGQYIPYPSTWLNGKRWEDEADTGFMNGHVHFDGTDVNHYEKIEDRSEDLNEW